jgi:hypothetical protein
MPQEIAELLDVVEGMLEGYENASPPMDRSKFAGELIKAVWNFGVPTMGNMEKMKEEPK